MGDGRALVVARAPPEAPSQATGLRPSGDDPYRSVFSLIRLCMLMGRLALRFAPGHPAHPSQGQLPFVVVPSQELRDPPQDKHARLRLLRTRHSSCFVTATRHVTELVYRYGCPRSSGLAFGSTPRRLGAWPSAILVMSSLTLRAFLGTLRLRYCLTTTNRDAPLGY